MYLPTVGEKNRLKRIIEEFNSHGCRFIDPCTYDAFEGHRFLHFLHYEQYAFFGIVFGPGAEIPVRFRKSPPFLPSIILITFSDTQPGDDEIVWAIQFPNIWTIQIIGEHHITQRGFRTLRKKPDIHLSLVRSTNLLQDIHNLSLSTELRNLYIEESVLDDDFFSTLSHLNSLEQLVITNCTGITSEGLAFIKDLHLKSLCLSGANLNNEHLKILAEMTQLKYLGISYNQEIDDIGADYLKGLPEIHFQGTGVSSEKIREFERLFQERLELNP